MEQVSTDLASLVEVLMPLFQSFPVLQVAEELKLLADQQDRSWVCAKRDRTKPKLIYLYDVDIMLIL